MEPRLCAGSQEGEGRSDGETEGRSVRGSPRQDQRPSLRLPVAPSPSQPFGGNRLKRTMCQKAATPSFQLIFFPSA